MPEPTKAVFLSYASQDAEAAKRIFESLRAAGVEVWLDQSELVGGDAWDQKIRGQVATCALFVPIVSANTQARREGYFRLEWKLADERTHLMAEGTPFLLPVVIDDTKDREALVPKSFLGVQWTRLRQGYGGQAPDDATTAFGERVKVLLGGDVGARAASPAPRTNADEPSALPRKSSRPWFVPAIISLTAVAALALWQPWKKSPAPPPPAAQPPLDLASEGLAKDAKSIAVLPFANRSPDKENEFFTDGVHEDILTNLFNIRALRVVSRTSVEQYRGTKKSLKEIGAELGVAYILEGSVQRVGNKVRVTGQLIDARTDAHLWAKSFDKDLSDVFAIQAEVAKAIAAELQTVLSPQEQKLLERRPTENIAAYDLYLKARTFMVIRAPLERVRLLEEAVELDPKFAMAWAELAITSGYWFRSQERTPARLDEANAALAHAVRLAPDAPDTVVAQGWLAYLGRRDYARAKLEFEKVIRLQPSNAGAIYGLATIQARQGHWLEAVANHRKALQLDPAGEDLGVDAAQLLEAGRRWDEARAVRERLNAARAQGQKTSALETGQAFLVGRLFSATGSTKAADDWLAGLTPARLGSPPVIIGRWKWRANIQGDYAEWKRLDALSSASTDEDGVRRPRESIANVIEAAMMFAAHGDRAGARLRLGSRPEEARSTLELEPTHDRVWGELALMEVLLGNQAEALRATRKAVELVPEALDAVEGPRNRRTLAVVQAWAGDKDSALAELTRLLRVPFGYDYSVHDVRVDPMFAPLRGDPRFEALLKDPKNHAPLF